jgi:hypothetical protein
MPPHPKENAAAKNKQTNKQTKQTNFRKPEKSEIIVILDHFALVLIVINHHSKTNLHISTLMYSSKMYTISGNTDMI